MPNDLDIHKEIQIFDFESEIQKAEQESDLEQMQKIAEKSARVIALKLEECAKNMEEAKKLANKAKNMEIGILDKITSSGNKKRFDALSDSGISISEAMSQMKDLISEVVKFTCLSSAFAKEMNKAMAAILLNGFKDQNGNIKELSKNSKKEIEFIIKQAEETINQKKIIEKNQIEIKQLESKTDEQEIQIDKLQNDMLENEGKIESIYNKTKSGLDKIFNKINKLKNNILENHKKASNTDTDLQNKINNHKSEIEEIKNILFKNEEKALNSYIELENKINEQQSKIERLENDMLENYIKISKSLKLSYILPVLSLLVSIITIVLFFMK